MPTFEDIVGSPVMSVQLTPEKALIFRITHIDNVPWILEHGVHCRNSDVVDPNFVTIGNPDLIIKRNDRAVAIEPGGTLSDYIPFYFTPYTPMMLNITTGYAGIQRRDKGEIAILVSSVPRLRELGVPFVFTDRHAYLAAARYFSETDHLDQVDWDGLQRRDFKRDLNRPEKVERYQAEALVYRHVPVDALLGIVCHDANAQSRLGDALMSMSCSIECRVDVRSNWFI